MLVLGIETSSFTLGLGLVEDDKVVFDLFVNSGTPQSEDIIRIMKEWIGDPTQIDGFGVSLGPGSFTGLRVGLATVKGLAIGLNKPVFGIPTLDAFLVGVPYTEYRITPIIDAKRGDIYAASYEKDGKRITPYLATNPVEFFDQLEGEHIFVGDGVRVYSDLINEKLGRRAHFVSPNPDFPRGSWVASIALNRLKKCDFDQVDSLEPIYLHPPRIIKK
ncbi:MAG: tRNA (adenosine(37)-N6)-threonylcarbamoyltransferase complex dimerization subunit type 1 TsaB [bacterium]|nr:tRNA (adenosine(37)-N6)-threonylcarbamoyltransferase complex dimerization subunit type 1 TsaB [bacterium]